MELLTEVEKLEDAREVIELQERLIEEILKNMGNLYLEAFNARAKLTEAEFSLERLRARVKYLDQVINQRSLMIDRAEAEIARLKAELAEARVRSGTVIGELQISERDRVGAEAEAKRLSAQKDAAYSERNKLVAAFARVALRLGWRAGVGYHPLADKEWEQDWRTIVFVDLPTGQVSWHFHDSERDLLKGLPAYAEAWDGHSTDEKYQRLAALDQAKKGG